MFTKYFLSFILISFSIICHAESGEILDQIKGGFDVAYNGVHCGFHKLKELVKHHEHSVDPCTGKSATTTPVVRPWEEEEATEIYQTNNHRGQPTEPTYGWRI